MVNRNAARHLLLVVGFLLFIFIYVGYRMRTRGEAPTDNAAAQTTALTPPPDSGTAALRPDSGPSSSLRPSDELAGWTPSGNGGDSPLSPPGAASLQPPPASSSPIPHSGSIAGLVPSPPGSSIRPPDAHSPESSGDEAPPLIMAGGDSAGFAPEDEFIASLPVPGAAGGDAGQSSDDILAGGPVPSFLPVPSDSGGAAPISSPPGAAPVGLAPPPSDSGPGGFIDDDSDDDEWENDDGWITESDDAPVTDSIPLLVPSGTAPTESLTPPAPGGGVSAPPPPPSFSPPPPSFAPPPPPGAAVTAPGGDSLAPPPTVPGTPATPADSLRVYVVRAGDTLTSIANRELGSAYLADNIFLLNRDVIDDPDHLLAGVKIRLPYANPDPLLPGGPAAGAPTEPGRRPTQGLGRKHIVVRGDTLSSIAEQYYGASAGWRTIHEANSGILPNPNRLSVGMELTIPPYEK